MCPRAPLRLNTLSVGLVATMTWLTATNTRISLLQMTTDMFRLSYSHRPSLIRDFPPGLQQEFTPVCLPIFSLLCSLCPFPLAMHCLTFGLRLLITPLVSSNFSYRGVASTLLLVRREFMRNVDAPLLVYLEHIFNNELDHPLTYISCLI